MSLLTRRPNVLPFEPRSWSSPLRGPWLASVISVGLLTLFAVDAVTGFLSQAAYQPQLGRNSVTGGGLDQALFGWGWPTHPSWLYAFTQGLHVTAGVAAIPLLAAKLWAVMPRFYKWPPLRSPADVLERASLGLLVGSAIFLLFTGVFNIAYWYPFGFSFVPAHYYAAFIFVGAVAAHIVIKLPAMARAFRERGVLRPLRDDLAHTTPEPHTGENSAPLAPAAPTISRRAWLGWVGVSSLGLATLLAGDSVGGFLRKVSLLSPRSQDPGPGPNGFQVNKTAVASGISPQQIGPSWRLALEGAHPVQLSREDLLRMPQHTHDLPIACVEGWSTTQRWTGVRLIDLARMAGVARPQQLHVQSLQKSGTFNQATLNAGQVSDPRALLALRVNGADLSPDHGFPARIIVPALPGVHNTKWVKSLAFRGGPA